MRLLQQAQTSGLIRDLSDLRLSAPCADAEEEVWWLAEYLVSQLAMIGQSAVVRPGLHLDLLYVQWAMVLPRICISTQHADKMLVLVRELLQPVIDGRN